MCPHPDTHSDAPGASPAPTGRPAPVDVAIHPLLAARWSARGLDHDRAVAPEEVRALLEAARWAPSNGNAQPWRFVVADDRTPEARERLRACLRPGNAWARAAPVLVLTLAAREFPPREGKPPRTNPHAWHDTGAATLALALEAAARGLVAHPMAGFDRAAAEEAVGAPADLDAVTLVAVGYPVTDPAALPEEVAERDARPRQRRPVDESAWLGRLEGVPVRP